LVTLTPIDQSWKSERSEVGIGKPNREGFGQSEVPGAASTTGRVGSQSRTTSQFQQCRAATALGFPLPPQRCTQSQPDPAGQVLQHHRRFAEAEITAPAPDIRGRLLYRLLDAHALCLSRYLTDWLLKPSQSAQAVQLPCIRHSLTPCRAQFCLIARLPPTPLVQLCPSNGLDQPARTVENA
jgi:hypothetical protein